MNLLYQRKREHAEFRALKIVQSDQGFKWKVEDGEDLGGREKEMESFWEGLSMPSLGEYGLYSEGNGYLKKS